MKTLKIKNILFSLLAIMAAAVFLTSCEQEAIDFTVEDNSLSAEDIDIHKESFVDFWLNINERVKNNGNLLNSYLSEQNEENLKEAFLKDIGYIDMDKTYSDFIAIYNYSLDKYKKSLDANGVNINDEDVLRITFSNHINENIIINRSCLGQCDADYLVDAISCVAVSFIPGAGFWLGLACVAANAYELDQCYDTCQNQED